MPARKPRHPLPAAPSLAKPGDPYVLGPMNSGKTQKLAMTPEAIAKRRAAQKRAMAGIVLRANLAAVGG